MKTLHAVRRAALSAALASTLAACVGTTGGDLVTFEAAAAGPEDAVAGQPLAFTAGTYQVELASAVIHIGALYLDETLPVSGAQATSCILPGTYVGQVTRGLDVDLLSPAPQRFPVRGEGIAVRSRIGEVWLTHGAVDDTNGAEPVLTAEGVATRGGDVFPFRASLSIGVNRLPPISDASQPGAHPICKERIVSPIVAEITPSSSGALLLRVDPRILFQTIDFASLPPASGSDPGFEFEDISTAGPSLRLYQTLRSARPDLYRFAWVTQL